MGKSHRGEPRPEDGHEHPAYGIRVPDFDQPESVGGNASSHAPASGLDGRSPQNMRARAAAYRRMAGGLSFAVCMLGILMVFGLAAAAHPRWAVLGGAPLLVGLSGLVAVRWRLAPAFRDQEGRRPRRRGSHWFWIPVAMVLLGIGFFLVGYLVPGWMEGADSVLVRSHVLLWSELGFLCLLMAGLSAGLIALALWTVPDDDEAILRQTDYAERRRAKEAGRPRDHYDSDWIRGNG